MKLPLFKASQTVSVNVPSLDGGIRTSDAPWLNGDNALAECRNLWYHNGLLRTRAGFWTSEAWKGEEDPRADVRYVRDSHGWLVSIILQTVGTETTLTVTAREPEGGDEIELLAVSVPSGTTYACVPSAGTTDKDTLLLYVSNGRIWALQPSLWDAVEVTSHIYVPTVMVNGQPREGRFNVQSPSADYQARNRLTDRVRCCYTPDGVGMYYYLPYRNITGDVHICVAGMAGSQWEYHIAENATASEQAEGRYAVLERDSGMFYFKDRDGENTVLAPHTSINSVAAECHVPFENPLVFGMTFGVWYGGDKSSTGGHRLFLSGNTASPHTVVWSVAENPFYFPENACATVGLSDNAITAFGKQDGSLVMFKEGEVYAAEYVRGSTDITDTSEAILPVYAIHTEIGCDCPDTVALMGGRLTWVCRDGNVYQLKSPSSYGSRGIVPVGEPIRPMLEQNDGTASACVWDGCYYLLYGWSVWVMTDAERHTWYGFVWPENGTQPYRVYGGNPLRILAKAGRQTFWFSLQGTHDICPLDGYRQLGINGMLRTKAYDFDSSAYKRVVRAVIHNPSAVTVGYHTDRGVYRDGVHRPDAGGAVICTPHLPRCRTWALRLEGEGLAVGGITAVARTEGGF